MKFGEVVRAPPKLCAQPRGSQSKAKAARSKSLLLCQKLNDDRTSNDTNKSRSKTASLPVGLKRKHDLDTERTHAIHVYRQIKKTRADKVKV